MDSDICIRHKVDLERMLHAGSAEPAPLALSLLEDITNCFSDDQQIGSGGFAVVYKGMVGKRMVAVKKLSQPYGMHEDKFLKEVECMVKAKHKNIVRFLGYCYDTQGRLANYEGKLVMADLRNWLLCFEYVLNGSLDMYITDASCGLEWRKRYKIIKGICEGLLHLHELRILHLDLKPGNILVDEHMAPKIADFGLSRCLDKEQTRVFTSNLCGSQGYLAPEFFGGQVAFASDIYSLGVIIMEILTGKKGYSEDENVVDTWMNRLEGSDQWETQLEQVRVCIEIGIECMESNPKKRPIAQHIINRLDNTTSIAETSISCSSVEQQVRFLKEHCSQEKNSKVSSEYLGKDIKEHAETKELAECVETPREDHWQQEASGDQWSSWAAQDTKQNVSPQSASIPSFKSGLLYKLKKFDIFGRKARCRFYEMNGGVSLPEPKCTMKLFKKEELMPFLNDTDFIKKDGFGEVYMGLVNSVPVTVRMVLEKFSGIRVDLFADEIRIQSQAIHRNIIRLIGCCLETDNLLLVYEFHSTVSLHDILHMNIKVPLSLGTRLSIATISAGALAYVHSALGPKISHGDVKPANILLDDHFVPKISNFGLSRLIKDAGTVINDLAYMDPVYRQTGLLTEKSDVYSFGVVILELLTRKKAKHSDNNSLVRNFLENHGQGRNSTKLFDKEIAVTGDLVLLDNLAEIAVECLNLEAERRPEMKDVAGRLERLKKVKHLQMELEQHVRHLK